MITCPKFEKSLTGTIESNSPCDSCKHRDDPYCKQIQPEDPHADRTEPLDRYPADPTDINDPNWMG